MSTSTTGKSTKNERKEMTIVRKGVAVQTLNSVENIKPSKNLVKAVTGVLGAGDKIGVKMAHACNANGLSKEETAKVSERGAHLISAALKKSIMDGSKRATDSIWSQKKIPDVKIEQV